MAIHACPIDAALSKPFKTPTLKTDITMSSDAQDLIPFAPQKSTPVEIRKEGLAAKTVFCPITEVMYFAVFTAKRLCLHYCCPVDH